LNCILRTGLRCHVRRGWPDLFCVQDGPVKPGGGVQPTNKLYRNNGGISFTDVTEAVGLNNLFRNSISTSQDPRYGVA
jgi:hypothetical protein